jgi:hypothetical protein
MNRNYSICQWNEEVDILRLRLLRLVAMQRSIVHKGEKI